MSKPTKLPELIWRRAVEDPESQFAHGGGKRIRAAMLRLSYKMAGGEGEVPADLVAAIETLHAGSLVIDDIEDGSIRRRGQPCLHLRVGVPVAINTGTRMYFQALAGLSDFAAIHPAGGDVLDRTIRVVARCHDGQAIDLNARVDELSADEIVPTAATISRLKTGELTALATWTGARVAGGNRTLVKALSRFGRNVGVCLQMHNDLDEIHRYVVGGDRCDDLRNARVTWAWAWAARRLPKNEFSELRSAYSRALKKRHGLPAVAADLLGHVGDYGRAIIAKRLDQQSRLLAEHVEGLHWIEQMTQALAPLTRRVVKGSTPVEVEFAVQDASESDHARLG